MSGASPLPADGGYFGWTYDTACLNDASGNVIGTAGTLHLFKIPISGSGSASTVRMWVSSAGSGLTANQNFVGLYDSNGFLLGTGSADQSTVWTSTGKVDTDINGGASVGVSSPFVWVGVLANGSTLPSFVRNNAISGNFANGPNLTASTTRFGGTGNYSTLPGSVVTNNIVNMAGHFWAAIF